jgi:SAM-dependent methyltransferase
MFRRSLKKQQKLRALLEVLGPLQDQRCLLVTCGDNNGALNWHFRNAGGHWTWVDAESDSIAQIHEITGDPVLSMNKETPSLPLPDNSYDLALTIDVHEHLRSPDLLNLELARVVGPGGKVVVTTPNGDPTKLANRMKRWVGMRKEDYGHVVDGYDTQALEGQLKRAGLRPVGSSYYSGLFTELIELTINLAYVKVMARRSKAKVQTGQIAPQNKEQLGSVEKSYRVYTVLYPIIFAVSRLDHLIPVRRGYAVIVAALKE